MAFSKRRSSSKHNDGPAGHSNIDQGYKVRLVTPNQAKREAWITGELKNARPPVTLPKFSWEK